MTQAGPAKANELFAKFSDTSDGAVKTAYRREFDRGRERPLSAARGIIIGLAITVPFWALLGIIRYLLMQ